MGVINGRLVPGFSSDYELIPNRYHRHLLVQHRIKKYWYLFDRLLMVNPDLQVLMKEIKSVSEGWAKAVKGRVVGKLLILFMEFSMYPQQYSHRADLMFYASYIFFKKYFQTLHTVLTKRCGKQLDNMTFLVPKKKLLHLSELYADELMDEANEMKQHYQRLLDNKVPEAPSHKRNKYCLHKQHKQAS